MTEITEQGRALLAIIHKAEHGVTRGDIAAAQNKKRLNVWDVKLLSDLESAGLITIQKRKAPGPIGHEFVYKAKES